MTAIRGKTFEQNFADPTVDAMIANVVKVLPSAATSEEVNRACEAIKKVMPYADPVYISYQIAKMRSDQSQDIKALNSAKVVEDFAHTLLEDSPKSQVKPGTTSSSSDSLLRKNSGGDFKSNPFTATLNSLQKNEAFNGGGPSPNMVIHVCDEAKNLKQDFDCPRDLLVREMRYFAEYLSVDSQRLEEVDISVHCDIHIFDWLMRYVKRGTKLIDDSDLPKLDPNNVISILISSDFLKMESLVEACISYCHRNLSAIVATPCNMNCVNDKLTSQIAKKFNHNELEDVRDRKDKFKSKLFCKKIEKLFDLNTPNADSPGNGNSLFKCSVCQRILTVELNSKLPCVNNRLSVSGRGDLCYEHLPDPGWDVNSFLISLYEGLRKWNLVYWRLWGIINYLNCSRCGLTFQLCDFSNCLHHPERPQYQLLNGGDASESPVGVYPCCNQQVLRFDPTGLNKGCRSKDHNVSGLAIEEERTFDDFIAHKALVSLPMPVCSGSGDFNIFASDELRCSIKETTMTPLEIASIATSASSVSSAATVKKTNLKKVPASSDNYEEDEAGEGDAASLKKSLTQLSLNLPQHSPFSVSSASSLGGDTNRSVNKKKEKVQIPTDSTSYRKYPSKLRWDSGRSIRFNQDIQREDDRRRMTSMTSSLAKQRPNEKVEKTKTKDPKEMPGGIFMKLEIAFFNNLKNQGGNPVQTLSRHYGGKDFKSKPRR